MLSARLLSERRQMNVKHELVVVFIEIENFPVNRGLEM